jgi:hypothetical protein
MAGKSTVACRPSQKALFPKQAQQTKIDRSLRVRSSPGRELAAESSKF